MSKLGQSFGLSTPRNGERTPDDREYPQMINKGPKLFKLNLRDVPDPVDIQEDSEPSNSSDMRNSVPEIPKDPEEETWKKTREFLCQFLHFHNLDLAVLKTEFEMETEANLQFWEDFCKGIIAKPDALHHLVQVPLFIQLMMGLKERELLSSIELLLARFDPDRLFMLNFEQLCALIEDIAKKHGFEPTSEYCRYLNKYDYYQGLQKDRFFSAAGAEKDHYFGPFSLKGVFDALKTDQPLETDRGIEYLTDFWKCQPLLLTFWVTSAIKKVIRMRERFHIVLGLTQVGTPMRGANNSVYSVLNALMQIDGDLQRLVPLKQSKQAIQIYRSLNSELREPEAEIISSELRDFYQSHPEGIPAGELIHWLGLRICMCLDFAVISSAAESSTIKETSPHLVVRRQTKMLEKGLFWTCAAGRETTPEDYTKAFERLLLQVQSNGSDSCNKLDLIVLFRRFLLGCFPNMCSQTALQVIAVFLEVSACGLKSVYTWDEVASFKPLIYPILLWMSVKKVKDYLRMVYKPFETEDSGSDTVDGNIDSILRPNIELRQISRLVEKIYEKSPLLKTGSDERTDYLSTFISVFRKVKLKSLFNIFTSQPSDPNTLVPQSTQAKPTSYDQNTPNLKQPTGAASKPILTKQASQTIQNMQETDPRSIFPSFGHFDQIPRQYDPSKSPQDPTSAQSITGGVMFNPYWKAEVPLKEFHQETVRTFKEFEDVANLSNANDEPEDAQPFRQQFNYQEPVAGAQWNKAGKQSNLGQTIRIDTNKDTIDKRKEVPEGRDLLEEDKCSLI